MNVRKHYSYVVESVINIFLFKIMDHLFYKSKIAKSTDYFIKFHTLMKRLKAQEQILYNNTLTAIKNTKCDDLKHFVSDLERKRKQDVQFLNERCFSINQSMEILSENVSSQEKMKNLDVEFYKNNLTGLEKQLSDVKSHIKNELELLQKKEFFLLEKIKISEQLLHGEQGIDLIKNTTTQPSPNKKFTKRNFNAENQDVRRFQTFLQKTGGHTGGWGEVEHNTFMKCWNKCTNLISDTDTSSYTDVEKIYKTLQNILPDIPYEEVIQHNNWLTKYKCLKEMQSKSVEIWKALREAHKYHKEMLTDSQTGEQQSKNATKINQESIKVKDTLEIWKKNKAIEKKLSENSCVDNILKLRKNMLVKDSERKLEKEVILKWTESKKREIERKLTEDEEQCMKEKKKRSQEANKKIQEFRQRDQEFIDARKGQLNQLRKTKSCNNLERRIPKKSSDYTTSKAPKQYDKPTEQWCSRIKKCSSVDTILFPGTKSYVDALPKLGMPKWRKGIMTR